MIAVILTASRAFYLVWKCVFKIHMVLFCGDARKQSTEVLYVTQQCSSPPKVTYNKTHTQYCMTIRVGVGMYGFDGIRRQLTWYDFRRFPIESHCFSSPWFWMNRQWWRVTSDWIVLFYMDSLNKTKSLFYIKFHEMMKALIKDTGLVNRVHLTVLVSIENVYILGIA